MDTTIKDTILLGISQRIDSFPLGITEGRAGDVSWSTEAYGFFS